MSIGDHILTNKYIYRNTNPQRGDLVVFPFPKDPRKKYIKRVIGLPGEIVEIKDKKVSINGKEFSDFNAYFATNKVFPISDNPRDNMLPVMVPERQVFVLGDNRDQSLDSRFFGFIDIELIKAKAELVYWSWDDREKRVRWNRIGKSLN